MLLRQTSIDDIRLGFAVLQGYVRPGGPLNLTDINVHAEDFVGNILNILYGWELINTNRLTSNYPCIDLLDTDRYVGIQVTTEQGAKKVNDTLSCSAKHLAGIIRKLYIFSLMPKQGSYKLNSLGSAISFGKSNILDFDDVLAGIKSSSDEKVDRIHKYVLSQMPALFASSHSRKRALRREIAFCLNLLNREVLRAPERFEQPMRMFEAIAEMRIELQKVGASRIASKEVAGEFAKIVEKLRQCTYQVLDEFPYFAKFPKGVNPPYNDFKPGDYERSIQKMMEIRDPVSESIGVIEAELKCIDVALA